MRGQARAIEQGRVASLRGKHLRVIAVKIAIRAIATKAGLHGFAVEMIGPLWVFRLVGCTAALRGARSAFA